MLYEAARSVREKNYGNKVFTYGFVYFSTYCRNNCRFCYYRHSNNIERYRKTSEEIVELSGALADSGVDMIDLTMGEDTSFLKDECADLIDTVREVKRSTGMPVMVSPGLVNEASLYGLKSAGADWYACYQETYNRELFRSLRVGQDFDLRLGAKRDASYLGLLTEEGIMTGIGESIEDLADSLIAMRDGGYRQVRVMSFVPQNGAPLTPDMGHRADMEERIIAVLRILCPDRLIPASMDVEGVSGLIPRLNAGANVITSIVPSKRSLAGVAQHDLDIENGNRSLDHIANMLDGTDYRLAGRNDYSSLIGKWMGI